MKIIYSTALIGLLVATVFMVPANALGVTQISGHVKNYSTGQPLNNVEIAFTETVTSQTVYATTDSAGYYYLALSSFTQGWSYGDVVNAVIQFASGFEHYFTSAVLASNWGATLTMDMYLVVIVQDQVVTNPWEDDVVQYQLACTANQYNHGIHWYHANNANINVPSADPVYDGVEIHGYMMVQDNGAWVSQGQTWRVYAQYTMKIQKAAYNFHVYYDQTRNLYDMAGNMYYEVSNGANIHIDPCHCAKLPKGGQYGIDNVQLKITGTLTWQVYDYTNQQNPQFLFQDSFQDIECLTYHWT